jgi:hypothetical protein
MAANGKPLSSGNQRGYRTPLTQNCTKQDLARSWNIGLTGIDFNQALKKGAGED